MYILGSVNSLVVMSDRAYWLSLFNQDTWQEFVDAGAKVMGFPETRQSTVRRIKPGDYLLGYLTKVSRWIAVLEVTSDPYKDLTRIWKQALFPCRVNVQIVSNVTPEDGVPALSLGKELQMFKDLKTPNWGLLFRIAPRELTTADGEIITRAVTEVSNK